jgi:hypothetical protein
MLLFPDQKQGNLIRSTQNSFLDNISYISSPKLRTTQTANYSLSVNRQTKEIAQAVSRRLLTEENQVRTLSVRVGCDG